MSDEVKRQVQANFSKNKEAYVTSSTHKNQGDLDLINEWLQPDQKWTVLDIATGGGHVAKALSPLVGSVFATDLTKDMLQNTATHLRTLPNIHFVVADAEALPFLDESFDAVTCRIAPHHFPSPETFITEVERVLKPGGFFLMIDNVAPQDENLDHFYNTFEKMRDKSHVRALKVSEWKQLLCGAGLSIEQELTRKKTLPFPDWVKRTTDNDQERLNVECYFQNADEKAFSYFSIKKEKDRIQSFSIDEWMVKSMKEA
ncbi:class I SAM-dependent methyltransferase [Halobacillus mangrovi]|uniref:SAM-dependent methyltransferase n=1 Tax=Halobacillus mangrovi TaxID=402384 RepID=A0A1W6A0H5_9BACI|nr:class I SAM-dependent methyltransferase [Halobacillus mangrovi]ARI78994.1 SAM-dependent methyltransferase [Halobacillus mangrovi]